MSCPSCGSDAYIKHGIYGLRQRKLCRNCGKTFVDQMLHKSVKSQKLTSKSYIVTTAINNSKVNKPFWNAIKNYANRNDAKIIVLKCHYRNPTSEKETKNLEAQEWYDQDLLPFLSDSRLHLGKRLVAMGDIRIVATHSKPLSGWRTASKEDDAILAHPRIALETVPTHLGKPAKIIQTTGACTNPNYSDTNSGHKGKFHHVLGACIVEIEGSNHFVRHVSAVTDGSFIDLNNRYLADGSVEQLDASVLVLGDIHAEMVDENAVIGACDLIELTKPKYLVLHDVINFGSASPHSKYFEKFARSVQKTDSVLDEIKLTCGLINDFCQRVGQVIVAQSNHHDHFVAWLEKHDNALDLNNALVYHKTKTHVLECIVAGKEPNPLAYWLKHFHPDLKNITWLSGDDSFARHGIEYAYHGHRGANGARGSTKHFANLGTKLVHGHTHCAQWIDGAQAVGTLSQLDMGYNRGSPSGWTHSVSLTYSNGKRTLLHLQGKKFYHG